MKYIAHRGFPSKAPENSIPSFQLAALSEAHFGIECDVQQTKDNQFIIFHDENLKRMTKKDLMLSDLTYDELKEIKIKSGKNIRKYPDLEIPLFKDFLEICSTTNKTAVVEIKKLNDITQVIDLLNIIEAYPSLSVIIISFDINYLKFIKAISDIPLQLLVSKISDDIIYDSRVNQFDLALDKKIVNKTMIKRLKKEGFKIAVWTVDDRKQAEFFKNMGIDFITSDKL
ncbi:MAG: hypothetical protein K9L02_08230 [Acholeplasmataceae bacterium]|nr:hypothetical protein [Acholeplasmataceae bacterium]